MAAGWAIKHTAFLNDNVITHIIQLSQGKTGGNLEIALGRP